MSAPAAFFYVSLLIAFLLPCRGKAEESFLRPNDVIALVGGEDMVAAAEYGYLELLLTRALPEHRLKFRCLAWEGDTVFEQRRDLNYPTLEQQLDQIGATVVIAQFGQMESLAGKEKLPEFVTAYDRLIGRLKGLAKRRVIVATPNSKDPAQTREYREALWVFSNLLNFAEMAADGVEFYRDAFHLSENGHIAAVAIAETLWNLPRHGATFFGDAKSAQLAPLLQAIRAKNRLWFHYYRPQNWAFLAGDRTNQPSSRDHLDPKKRWFPEELQQFLPLIDAKEQEIWEMAAALAAGEKEK